MADKRIFTIQIDGVDKAVKDVETLIKALSRVGDVNTRVRLQTDETTQATEQNTRATRTRTTALTEEEKAERRLQQTLERRRQLDTQTAREQINATQALRERTRELQRSIQLENAESGSIEEMRLQLGSLTGAYRALSKEEREAEHIGGAMLTQIQELRAEYNELERSLGNHAVNVGNYESATHGLNNTLNNLSDNMSRAGEQTQGMLNLFQAGVGIALMFDEENSQLSKTMNSLGKILAIVGALQQANNLLLAKGAVASKASAIMEGIHAVQVRARASAIALATKNTIGATVAQTAFNIVAKANPYVLLAMALVTVIGALAMFAMNTESATEKQSRMNDAVQKSIELKDQQAGKIKSLSDAQIADMQRELDLMKAQGASQSEIAKKEKEIHEQKLANAKKNAKYYEKEIKDIDENAKRVDRYTAELLKLDADLYAGRIKNMESYQKKRDAIVQKLEISNRRLTQGLNASNELKQAENDLAKFVAGAGKTASDAGKKHAVAMAEYRVLIAKKGSREELKAQIDAINERLKAELNSADITKGERLKKTEEALQQIKQLEDKFRQDKTRDDIELLNARLLTVKKGSLDEYNLQLNKLEKLKELELDNKDLTENQKQLIQNRYLSESEKITNDYLQALAESEINTNISTINARLANAQEGTKAEFDLRIELAKKNAELQKEQAKLSIENETERSEKIKEINAQLNKEISTLSADGEISEIEGAMQAETLALTKQLEARTIKRREFEKKMLDNSIKALEKEIKIRKRYGQDTTDLEIELSNNRIEQAENEANEISDYFAEMHDKIQNTLSRVMEGVNAIFDGVNALFSAQLEDAQNKYDAISEKYDELVEKREESDDKINSLEEKAKNARGGRLLILQNQLDAEMQKRNQLLTQEKNIAKEKEKLEKEIARKEKQQKKAQLASDIANGMAGTALAVINALQVKPFPLGVVLASVAGAMGALQVGVMSAQMAKLEDGGLLRGKRHANGGMRIEGTNIEVEGGEYVINRESTAKNIGLIRYINNQRRELNPSDINHYFKTGASVEPPFKQMFEAGGQLPVIDNSVTIDNGALIEAIGSLKIEPVVSVTDINTAQNNLVSVDQWTDL